RAPGAPDSRSWRVRLGRVHVGTRPSRSLRSLTLRLGALRRARRRFATINPVFRGLPVEGLLLLRGLILEGPLLPTATPGRCFPQAACQLIERLQQLEGQLTKEPKEQHDLPDDESERHPDPGR
ncbi:MAG: hypothetical protein JWR58_5414, partial [Pseudonocardia sp.]|nr:hypothetical protein [Pseudonocardia sp.]